MLENKTDSELRRADLIVEAKSITQQYENLLANHMALEKGLRARRSKVETQLSNWFTKFDTDIGDRQKEFEKLTAEYLYFYLKIQLK